MKLISRLAMICACGVMLTSGHGVSADEPPTVTAFEIQQYIGVQEGDRVRFEGICTVESSRYGYSTTVASDPGGGDWAGIQIYDGGEQRLVAERGEYLVAVGEIDEYYDKTEITCINESEYPPQALNEFGVLPQPLAATVLEMNTEESLESCIIELNNVEVLSNPDQYGSIWITDGTDDGILLLRSIDPPPPIGTIYDCLFGHLDYHFAQFKIRPRDEGDHICQSTPTPTANPCIHDGDVNQSGDVTSGDAQLAFQVALGMYSPSYEEECAADCNGDDVVTAGDAQQIFLVALGSGICAD